MDITVLAVGKKQPSWIDDAFNEYAKRLQQECKLKLIEISAANQSKSSSPDDIKAKEARAINNAIPANSHVIALDEQGKSFSSKQFAQRLDDWLNTGMSVCFIIGGAEGLDDSIKSSANECWSLSALTLPHGLARVLLAEQAYRAWTILKCHPYHRS